MSSSTIPVAESSESQVVDRPEEGRQTTSRLQTRKPFKRLALLIPVAWLLILSFLALTVQWLPIPRYDQIVGAPLLPPFSSEAILGTDAIGRSLFSRVLYGARASLTIGVVATSMGVVIGGLLGLAAGYFRGIIESVVDVLAEVVQAFPAMLFLIALAAAMRPSLSTLTISLAVFMIPAFARMTKGAVLAQTSREFVSAARVLGASHWRIAFREVLPNTLMNLVSFSVISMALVIVIEGSVSFLGYGIPMPYPSWGGMVAEAQSNLATHPSAIMVPIVFLFLTVYSLNALGEQLRRRFDIGSSQL